MLKRVYGQCNNQEIEFNFTNEGRWETVVPHDLNGTYYLNLYAEDDAGNVGFLATGVATHDANSLSYEFKIIDYTSIEKLSCFDINDEKLLKSFIEMFKYCKFYMAERSDCDWNLLEEK